MSKILPTDWRTQAKIFEEFGCQFIRQKGSHLIYHHPDAKRAIVIPRYDEVPVTIIRNNMRTVNMQREEYFRLLSLISSVLRLAICPTSYSLSGYIPHWLGTF